MSSIIGIIYIIILVNIFTSYKGFKDPLFIKKHQFNIDKILINKEYGRLFSSGFIHANWLHLLFNMLTLYLIGSTFIQLSGWFPFLAIYFGSLLGGNIFSLIVHRKHGSYRSIGASGAVLGVLFAAIAIIPNLEVSLMLIPVNIPSWIFGPLYIIYTIYGIRSQQDNIGHEAHFGGAIFGLLISLAFHPSAILDNYLVILAILLPSIAFIYIVISKPYLVEINTQFHNNNKKYHSIDDRYNAERASKKLQIDRILEKINDRGINSLSKEEKKALDNYSENL